MMLVSGIDDYSNARHMKANYNDLCLTDYTGQLIRMNIISKEMTNLLGKKGKKVWNITHDIE